MKYSISKFPFDRIILNSLLQIELYNQNGHNFFLQEESCRPVNLEIQGFRDLIDAIVFPGVPGFSIFA